MAPPDQPRHHPILRTKLHRPPVVPDLVRRARLHELMDRGLHRPLTVVSAPAGYGKSMLVSRWLESRKEPRAWLSLDESDSDLHEFVGYLIAAVQTAYPDACADTLALLNAPILPPMQALAGSLINELDAIDEPFILVLDDYHRIAAPQVHELLGRLLQHPPRHLHLVIATRRDPPLSLAPMLARDRMTEVRLKDLEFTVPETATLLKQSLDLSVSDNTLDNLQKELEGWIAGLHLVTLTVRYQDDPESFLSGLHGGLRQVQGYLMKEVFAHQPSAMQDWLRKTSILNRFCAPLCEAVAGTDLDGRTFVHSLETSGLFCIALDERSEWYRYHHLFQGLLQRQLTRNSTAQEIAALHLRASEWFENQGLIEQAIRHALDGGEAQLAVRVVERHRYDEMNTERWDRLGRWLKMLPPETVAKNPILLTAEAYICEFHGQVDKMIALRERAEGLLSTLQPPSLARKSIEGELAALKGELHIISGEGELAVACADRALELLPPEALHIRSFAIGEQVLANQMAGDMGRGLRIITERLNEHASLPGISEARMMLMSCLAYWMEGDLNGLKQSASRCLKLGEQHALPESTSFGRYFLGVQHYARNELLEAERHLASIVDHPLAARPRYLVHSALALALIHTARGRDEDASSVVESMLSHTMETNDTSGSATVRAFQVDLAVRQGRVGEARRLITGADFEPFPPLWFFYTPQLTPVRLLLAEKTPESLEAALAALNQLDEFLRRVHRKTVRVDALSLQALVLDAKGEEPAALEKVTEALALAAPGGFILPFLELGRPMADLLERAMKQGLHGDYARAILAAFGARASRPAAAAVPLVDPLTNREEEILELLEQRLRDKEIAARLCVSTETVKYHLRHVYQKLGVGNRREAVAKGRSLGLLVSR